MQRLVQWRAALVLELDRDGAALDEELEQVHMVGQSPGGCLPLQTGHGTPPLSGTQGKKQTSRSQTSCQCERHKVCSTFKERSYQRARCLGGRKDHAMIITDEQASIGVFDGLEEAER